MTPADALSLALLALVVAMANALYEMNEATKPQYRPGCRECAAERQKAMEAEKWRQERLAREWEERSRRQTPPGAGSGEDAKQEPPKRPGGGWMV